MVTPYLNTKEAEFFSTTTESTSCNKMSWICVISIEPTAQNGAITMKNFRTSLTLMITILLGMFTANAQTLTNLPPLITYYLASDADNVQQVFQKSLERLDSESRQITHAETDVRSFGTAYDGLSIAYMSGGALWLQPIHSETPEKLAALSIERFFSAPVYSADNQYIAYADNGVWLFDLSTRETRRLLEDVQVLPDGSNMAEMRLYRPVGFVLDENGSSEKLILNVGVWEWQSAGVYDLITDELQILADGSQFHTDILPLSDGRALLFRNNAVAGEFALHLAHSLDDINSYEKILDFASLTDATLFASQAVEIASGVVRVFGQSITPPTADTTVFNFDIDLNTGERSDVRFTVLRPSTTGSTFEGMLSPDGTLAPIYTDTLFNDQGGVYGGVYLLDVITEEAIDVTYPPTIGDFGWQPQF
jgi:hypothetical protein